MLIDLGFSRAGLVRYSCFLAAVTLVIWGAPVAVGLYGSSRFSVSGWAFVIVLAGLISLRHVLKLVWLRQNWQALLQYRLSVTAQEIRFDDATGTHRFALTKGITVLPDCWVPGMAQANPFRRPRGILLSPVPRQDLTLPRADLLAAARKPGLVMVRLGAVTFLPVPASADYIFDLCAFKLGFPKA